MLRKSDQLHLDPTITLYHPHLDETSGVISLSKSVQKDEVSESVIMELRPSPPASPTIKSSAALDTNDLATIGCKRFFLFGHPIGHSISPLLHRSIFERFGLPHTYDLAETLNVEEIITKIKGTPNFGGASVTMPHKVAIIPLLDSLSEAASKIGAVNTIIPKYNGHLHGDNTDWLGIRNCIRESDRIEVGLVLGAGGTARAAIYALSQLGLKTIYVYNRSKPKLQSILTEFGAENLIGLYKLEEIESLVPKPTIIVDTTPINARICSNAWVNSIFKVSLGREGQPCTLVKLAYGGTGIPTIDPGAGMVELDSRVREITGIDIVIEQAIYQSYLWTGQFPDSGHVKGIVKKFFEKI